MDKETAREYFDRINATILSGNITSVDALFEPFENVKLTTDQKLELERKHIRILWTRGEFEAANRRLSALMKKSRFKPGTEPWVENYLLRAYINQSLGHTSTAKKDLEKILSTIRPSDDCYQSILFNIASMKRDRGESREAESLYQTIIDHDKTTPEMISRSALAIARIRSDLDQIGIRTYSEIVRENAPRWGGWSLLKVAEIVEALDDFRAGMCGKGIRDLHRHVKEADESDFTAPRIRARIALAEALIELGDYKAALELLDRVGVILTSLQHSGLRHLQSVAELLWFQAYTRQSGEEERLTEALDRLEILLAVIAKYPRPPGPAPFWITIGRIQRQLGQQEQALRSLRKARVEADAIASMRLSATARYIGCALEWEQIGAVTKQHGAERNRILAETTQALESVSTAGRPELEWRIHYLRGKIFAESGEQYPSREEMKTAARIATGIILSMEDPSLQTLYRQSAERNEALIELQEFMDIELSGKEQLITATAAKETPGVDTPSIADTEDSHRLQDLLDALYRIHSSDALEDMASILVSECLQILDGDRCRIRFNQNYGMVTDTFKASRSAVDENVEIPGRWIREVSRGKGVFSYVWNADETNPESRNVLMTALEKGESVPAIIYIDRRKSRDPFSTSDESILKTLSSVASIACSSLIIRSRLTELSDQFRREIVPEFKHIIGESRVMKDIFIQMQRVALADIPVLIVGDTGTGKDLIARTIHEISPRAEQPFVYLDCSAIPMTLLESELFGIAEGIATGVESRVGLLEYANGGTILMDEVGDVPLNTQAKLLRVLQEREFEPVGSDQTVNINIRVIATTSRNLRQLIEEGKMREDFYYRLSGVVINIPPLRKRPGDVLLMARTFLHKYNHDFDKKITGFSPELLDAMSEYEWPGNVRELDHRVRKAVLFCQGEKLTLDNMDLPTVKRRQLSLKEAMAQLEEAVIKETLELTGGDVDAAARALDVSEHLIHRNTGSS